MPYVVRSPRFSFVRFDEEQHETCNPLGVGFCLPVFAFDDVAFQFIVEADTEAEADALCVLDSNMIAMGLVGWNDDCSSPFLLDLTATNDFERFRISPTQLLYNWPHGFPGFDSFIGVGDCFKIVMEVGDDLVVCSNCFQRVNADCYTSVVEYGSSQNIFGFNYCGSGGVTEDEEEEVCEEPTIFQFVNATEIDYDYTPVLQAKYGVVPTVKIYIDDGSGNFVEPIIQVGFDAYPPTKILADLGGAATGFMKISK